MTEVLQQAPRELYPALEPFNTGFLEVGDGHRLYFEESGNADGVPIVYNHGGPGFFFFIKKNISCFIFLEDMRL